MTAAVLGIGCVSPLGFGMDEVWRRLNEGALPAMTEISNPETGRRHLAAHIPPDVSAQLATLGREPRLRRASAISLFAAAAGKAALADAGIGADAARGLAVVFAVSSGSVQYTRRFYEQVVKQGANAASPLLFPETVYNAPASHLAAMLGVNGPTYTLVGDATAGMQAVKFGAQLLAMNDAAHVLVVAAEELDWILAEAHREWRVLASQRAVPHQRSPRTGALIAEGAAAVLLSAGAGKARIEVADGGSFTNRREAAKALSSAVGAFSDRGAPDVLLDGANGTWVDDLISESLSQLSAPPARTLPVKEWFGEAIGCAALQQLVAGVDALTRLDYETAIAPCIGWNQQAMAAWITRTA